jgi:hypothetical protein
MFLFTRWGFACLRWLITAGFSLLIVQLLILETNDRRPFVQRLALRGVVVVESACGQAKDFIFADVTASPDAADGEVDSSDADSPPLPELPPSDRQSLESDLPEDFLDQLEQALARSGKRADLDDWAEFRVTRERAARVESAVKLARNLPPQWWRVDGEMVDQLDLPTVLRNRTRK